MTHANNLLFFYLAFFRVNDPASQAAAAFPSVAQSGQGGQADHASAEPPNCDASICYSSRVSLSLFVWRCNNPNQTHTHTPLAGPCSIRSVNQSCYREASQAFVHHPTYVINHRAKSLPWWLQVYVW